ncbi:MAG: alpha/beta fold hydrolase [Acidobacteria bacterium]|nr:alpha/beta fold hydrolase [Acidobacteriota bacterium]
MRRALLPFFASLAVWAQTPAALQLPDDVQLDRAAIISEGTRMAAEKFYLKTNVGKKLPCVLMAHGWGGTMRALRLDAVAFARAGYFVVTFDYRGWGESDSRLVLAGPAPAHKPGDPFTAQVKEVREVVDPLDFGADWLNAIHWAAAEPGCDIEKLGLWGSSFSGGLVVWAAARDSRVKAIFSQVGALDGRQIVNDRKKLYDDSTKRARGEIGYPAPLAVEIGQLRGAPIRSRFAGYAPIEDVANAPRCAMRFVIAEKEELFDNKDHAVKAYALAKGPKDLVTVPNIPHYGIYREARQQAQQLAVEWFDKHLKK